MPTGKKLIELDRDELLTLAQKLIIALDKKHQQLAEMATDLPPNKAANDRHQKHKLAWGRTKTRMVKLLDAALAYVPDELAAEIKYELDHAEFLYQLRVKKEKTRKRIRLAKRLGVPWQSLNMSQPTKVTDSPTAVNANTT